MSYFKKYPLLAYEFNGQPTAVVDILRRTYFTSESRPYSNLYTAYNVPDGGTPQSVANELYGSPYYHWVIMMFNQIYNIYFDWPMQQLDLDSYCKEKYGIHSDGEYVMFKTRHYEINNLVVGQVDNWSDNLSWQLPEIPRLDDGTIDQLAYPVTFYEYENDINDEKRRIKVLKPELLGDFVAQFEKAINV